MKEVSLALPAFGFVVATRDLPSEAGRPRIEHTPGRSGRHVSPAEAGEVKSSQVMLCTALEPRR